MKKSYQETYAIAVRDTGGLFLMFTINRDLSGDVYVNFNKRDIVHNPHSSYHASGQLHHKSYSLYILPIRKKQPPLDKFLGTETIVTTSISKGDARAWNLPCKENDYSEVMEIAEEIISPKTGYQFSVELIEPGIKPWISTYPYARIVQQKIFKNNPPWIAASLYEISHKTFPKVQISEKEKNVNMLDL